MRCACGSPLPFAARRCFACAADCVRDFIAWTDFLINWKTIGVLASNRVPQNGPYR